MKTAIVGLTGGIGSGKSTVAGYFKLLGVPVYIADDEAKKILYTDEVSKKILAIFGDEVYTDGIPDRQKLAGVVFKNPEKLELLNAVIHPKVRDHFENWVEQNSEFAFVIKEAAILFESGSYKDCDKIILVTAPYETRIERVMLRDNTTREKVLERMESQWSDEKKIPLSNYIVENTSLQLAKEQVNSIYKEFKANI